MVTRETARLIANVPFKRISISLDGPDSATHDQFRRVPGAFDLAVDGFIHLRELGMSMQVNTAGAGIAFISHLGEVFPCGYLPIKAGDARRRSFADVWESAEVFAALRDADRLTGKCGACEYRTVCGGCRAHAYGHTGRYLDEEPFCTYLPNPSRPR